MKFIALKLFALTIAIASFAGDPKYPVDAIPAALKADANVVFRENNVVFRIIAKGKASYAVHRVITILNDKGNEYATEVIAYDKLSKVKDVNAAVYDASGKQIKRLKNSEVYDQSAFDGYSLYSDARLKYIDLTQGIYPYTIEFDYEIEYRYLLHIPSLTVVPEEKISVQHTSYVLQFPAELKPRYRVINSDAKPREEKLSDGFQSLTWSFSELTPIHLEPSGPTDEVLVTIMAAPTSFEYEKYSGTMETWDDFGRWIADLNRGRNMLPQATKDKVVALTASLKTREEKVKALYEYLQSKTRYVSIQLGIGGFQPFEASVVDETGYGDCKALSNYMVAMLDVIGIKSNYVLIRAGENAAALHADFPSSQFNHAIVAVPNGADTLWLECTSQSNPFGYQGTFTGDRQALLITERGASLANTKRYSAEQNLQSRTADVTVEMSGDANAVVKTTYAGLQYENDDLHAKLNNAYEEQKKWVQKTTQIPNFDLRSFSMVNHKNKIPSAEVSLDLRLQRFATVSGKRIFLTPNLMNRSTTIPKKVEDRKTSVIRRVAYTDMDTIRYHLPEGIYPEFLPPPVKIKNQFGEYETNYFTDQGSLVYVRKVKMYKGTFPATSYQELTDFYRSINKSDQTKVVFLSKT